MNKDKAQEAVNEIAEVCKKHGVFLYGYSADEDVKAEIVIADVNNLDSLTFETMDSWRIDNDVEDYIEEDVAVTGIGFIDK